ncbi:MAG: PhoU domain-containing protein [Promethearchaeota archaeon]
MEQRKIMQLGRSSLVISLPKDWLKRTNLKQGDFVSLNITNNGSLQISPLNFDNFDEKEITLYVDAEQDRGALVRSIVACYLNGYSNIKLIAKTIFTNSQLTTIRKIARMLYIRIIESDTKSIHMEILVNESKIIASSYIQRMYMISYSMLKDAFQALIEKNTDLARSVYTMDDDVDHFCFFLLRLLRRASIYPAIGKKIQVDPTSCQDFIILVYRIEHVADNANTIAQQIISIEGKKLSIPEKILNMIYAAGELAINMYEKAFKSFFSGDVHVANSVIEIRKKIDDSIVEIASESFTSPDMNPITVCAVCSMRDTVKRISDWAVAIAEHAITRAYFNL